VERRIRYISRMLKGGSGSGSRSGSRVRLPIIVGWSYSANNMIKVFIVQSAFKVLCEDIRLVICCQDSFEEH